MAFTAGQEPAVIQKKIARWAKNKDFQIQDYRTGFVKLRIGKGYSRALVIFYILTLWIGAIIHRLIKLDHGTLTIFINPYGPGSHIYVDGQGLAVIKAIRDLKREIRAKVFKKRRP